jgi:hypothetical protein
MVLPLHALLLAAILGGPLHDHAPHRGARAPMVVAIATPIAEVDILAVLRRTAGHAPRNRVLMAWALVALENARGRKVYGNNLGNVGPGKGKPRFKLRDGGYYQAFATPRDGAVRLWAVLTRCSAAMASADAGDGLGAARSLRRCGYHRTDPSRYGGALRSLYWEASKRWPVRVKATRRIRVRPTLFATVVRVEE